MTDLRDQARLERYQRLIEISRDLASTLDLEVLLNRIVALSAELTSAEAASILLYDEGKRELYFEASTNLDTPLMRGLIVPVDNSIAGWIITNLEPIIVSDAHRDPRFFVRIEKSTKFKTTSILGTPMIAKGKVVGVLEALNKINGDFTLDDQEMLMTLSAQAAIAIENARLFMQSDLISEMVHELRTPLGSLNTAAHILNKPTITQEQQARTVKLIQAETKRLSEMTTSFLDLARLESGRAQFQIRDVDLVIILGECVGLMHNTIQEHQLNFEWQVPDGLPLVTGDPDKIKQVAINLLSNAIKYNRQAGKIILKAEVRQEQGNLAVSVTDSGPGIPEEHRKNLFQKFYRVPGSEKLAMGTGLGLSIVKKIVEAHGGSLEVASEVGVGTTFIFVLPLKK